MRVILLLLALSSDAWSVASFTASVNGNWNDGATWGNASPGAEGVDYPGANDIPTIVGQKVVTIPSGYAVSPASITLMSGTAGNITTLIINGNLTIGGHINMGSGSSGYSKLSMGPGGRLNMGANNIILNDNGFSVNHLYFVGTSASTVTVTSSGGGIAVNSFGGFDMLNASWSYVGFSGLGDMAVSYGTTGSDFQMSHCSWLNSGQIYLPLVRTDTQQHRYIEYSDIRNPTNDIPIRFDASNALQPTGRNEVIYTTIGSGSEKTIYVDSSSVSFRNNVFQNTVIQMVGVYALDGEYDSNIFFSTAGAGGCATFAALFGSVTINNNFLYSECDNPHYISHIGTNTISYNIIETNTQGTITDDGDIYMGYATGAGVSSGVVKNNIVIGKRAGSPLLSFLGNAALTEHTSAVNNTIYFDTGTSTSDSCFSFGETYAGKSNMFPYIGNNLCVASSSSTAAHIVRDLNAASADLKVSTMNCNGRWNIAGAPYQVTRTAGSYGANDVHADPDFVDTTRELIKWDTTNGGAGTSVNAAAEMLKLNGYGGTFDSNYTIANLLSYVRAGFTPQAADFDGTGCDGSDIGAVSFTVAASAPATPASGSICFGPARRCVEVDPGG